ncbi:MAG: penicillin-binding protein [Oscillospiraceae bacterium]|jgi:peptidoglycan glycosyltransferase|nr:penicillin-binding protein [Oscillospiraceae bacterium]
MHSISKRVWALLALILAFAAGSVVMLTGFAMNGERWASNRANSHIFSGGSVAIAGGIYDRSGMPLAVSKDGKRVMAESAIMRKATLHAVGDPEGFISAGAQSAFRDILAGYDPFNGIYELTKYGKGSDVVLTIDANLCKTAYEALDGRKGTVGVYNYKTGEILCMVSSPTYDPLHKPKDMDGQDKYEAVYLNRFLQGVFTPGSTFKTVTSACALQNIPDIQTRTFFCDRRYATGDGYVICRAKHGTLPFGEALSESCNAAFAAIADELGETNLRSMAAQLGFGKPFSVDGIPLAISTFPAGPLNNLELGWTGVGQHTTLANPCHMMVIMGAIANGGNGVNPRLIKELISPAGHTSRYGSPRPKTMLTLDPFLAASLQPMLCANVTDIYDPGLRKSGDLELCGKTGTAEVDGKTAHAWFAGFCQNPNYPYAIVVVGENAGGGFDVALPIAIRVLNAMK